MSKVAVVTGASRGIGRAIAIGLGRQGAAVVVHYAREAAAADAVVAAIRAEGGQAMAFGADLSDPAQVRGFWPALDAARPADFPAGLDILVCNAGVSSGRKTIEAVTEEELDLILQVNFKAPFLMIQGAIPRIADGGRIIGISSMATRAPFPEFAAYAPSKAALESLMALLAVQLGPRGITVNAVMPGATETDMNPMAANPARAAAVTSAVALRRLGQPEDVADVVLFLASGQGGWVTGQVLDASGGQRL
jgi:NAD(P)-dependent dehydrogenase (short-subunit alcohol dehydrogenase family)